MSGENVLNGFRHPNALGNNAFFLNGKKVVNQYTFVIAPGAANICNVQITQADGDAIPDLTSIPFHLWLSDSATGLGLTATTASGTVQVKSASGFDLGILTAKKSLRVQPLATGLYTLEITDTAKTGFYLAVANPVSGQVITSRQLLTADYG